MIQPLTNSQYALGIWIFLLTNLELEPCGWMGVWIPSFEVIMGLFSIFQKYIGKKTLLSRGGSLVSSIFGIQKTIKWKNPGVTLKYA